MNRYQKECVVPNEKGIHMRPGCLIVEMANNETGKQKGAVWVRKKDSDYAVDASQMIKLMTLAAGKGCKLVVFTEDAKRYRKAVDKIAELIADMQTFDSEP
jgi:phosphotransferase system HPr (HPr) family protein